MSKLILGTVQLGKEYGINSSSKPSFNQALEILQYARENGIQTLDTAMNYGDAHKIIAEFNRSNKPFSIITKTQDSRFHINSLLEELNIKRLKALLLHDAKDFLKFGVPSNALEAKEQDKAEFLGVSVYTNKEFKAAINHSAIDLIQLPFNLLDNWFLRGELIQAAKEKGKIIHTRSTYLQGLFFKEVLPDNLIPLKPYLDEIKNHSKHLQSLALNYPLSIPEIDGVLIGVDSLEQLKENLESPSGPTSFPKIEIAQDHISLLNPVNW